MNESVTANGYEFFFEAEKLQPPIGRGAITHEVKVIRIYDREHRNQRIYDDVVTGQWPSLGKGEREALDKCAAKAKAWAEEQPSDRS